jgi:alpha/beta superfamily hydrolase
MDVWLLPAIAERLAEHGWASLRFNFRTVGRAEPTDGRAECADLEAALDVLAARLPEVSRLAVVGWSFGALVGMLYGPQDPRITDWVGIGAPTRFADQAPMALPPADLDRWSVRKTVIVGEHDTFFPPSTVGVLHPDTVHIVPGADHFLFDRDDEVADLVVSALS